VPARTATSLDLPEGEVVEDLEGDADVEEEVEEVLSGMVLGLADVPSAEVVSDVVDDPLTEGGATVELRLRETLFSVLKTVSVTCMILVVVGSIGLPPSSDLRRFTIQHRNTKLLERAHV
jgi:hypothetical protein